MLTRLASQVDLSPQAGRGGSKRHGRAPPSPQHALPEELAERIGRLLLLPGGPLLPRGALRREGRLLSEKRLLLEGRLLRRRRLRGSPHACRVDDPSGLGAR